MALVDFRSSEPGTRFDCDICVVGSGPAGLAIALEFANTPISVCLVESGGFARHPETEALNLFENVGARRAPADSTRCRGLGGTSALWSGRCGILDAIDFEARHWVPASGWPIAPHDIAPFLERAGTLLGLGPALYTGAWPPDFIRRSGRSPWDERYLQQVVWQFSRGNAGDADHLSTFVHEGVEGGEHIGVLQHSGAPAARRLGEAALPILRSSANIRVLIHATVTAVNANPAATAVESVDIACPGGSTGRVHARRVVLACGGIENARLLLASRSVEPEGLGNRHDMVGRYLGDHPFWPIAAYAGPGSRALRRRFGTVWLDRGGGRHVYVLGVRLSPEIQRGEQLLNCAAHVAEFGDCPAPISRLGKAARLARRGGCIREAFGEAAAALAQPVELAEGLFERYARGRPPLTRPSRVVIGAVAEQLPDPDSRVLLSDQTDALGMPRARIRWRISDREFETAKRMADVLKQEMRRLDYDLPDFAPWLEDTAGAFREEIHDMAHPVGTTRMSDHPSEGVVDATCQVHGVDGLYVAGSSVFCTSGHMNPTLTIVALSLRLADHLKTLH